MKKWILLGIAAIALMYFDLLPFQMVDTGKLIVVETLVVEKQAGKTVLFTDELSGSGDSLQSAISSMRARAPGELFLRQVKRIVLCGPGAEEADLSELTGEVPLGAAVYRWNGAPEELKKTFSDSEKRMEAHESRNGDLKTLANWISEESPNSLEAPE